MKMKTRVTSYTLYFIITLCTLSAVSFGQNKYPTADIEPYFDLTFTQAERDSLFRGLEDYRRSYQALHQYKMKQQHAYVTRI
jgi:hypothetical protein